MDTVEFVFGSVIFGILVLGCVGLLITIIRLSIISGIKTRGSNRRIRNPDLGSIKDGLGYTAPTELLDFFKNHPAAQLNEISVKNRLSGQIISICNFIPFSLIDIEECRKVTGCSGVPLATDFEKGVYHICIDHKSVDYGKVLYDNPSGRRIAAESVASFLAVDVVEKQSDDDDVG